MDTNAKIKGLLKFLSSAKGDLSNTTAPPFLLAPLSVTEVGSCWTERPLLLAAPAREPDPGRRALLVLRWFLASLKSQLYAGSAAAAAAAMPGPEENGEKQEAYHGLQKPLNAFLGEIFLGSWTQELRGRGRSVSRVGAPNSRGALEPRRATARLVAEQVSHHPPITAVYMEDDEHGIHGEGYTRVEMTYSSKTGAVIVRQVGHAVVQIDRFDEAYLIPLPEAHIRGVLSMSLRPDIEGTYRIPSSSGFVSEIVFTADNTFEARVYYDGKEDGEGHNHAKGDDDDDDRLPLYSVSGRWSGAFTIRDCRRENQVMEVYDTNADYHLPAELNVAPLDEQDPWESHRAWRAVRDAIRRGDPAAIADEKSRLERAQREMRAREQEEGRRWRPLLFRSSRELAETGEDADAADDDEACAAFRALDPARDWRAQTEKTMGVWGADLDRIHSLRRPFRGDLTPLG